MQKSIKIAVVGKSESFNKSYSAIEEAFKKANGIVKFSYETHWIDSKTIDKNNVGALLKEYDGILLPGGFGYVGTEGMILAIEYARNNKTPLFGICLGMQLTVIEFARDVANLNEATSGEFDPESTQKVIDRIPDLAKGTLLEGSYPCVLKANSLIEKCYQSLDIEETFNHGYTFNNEYADLLEEKGLVLSALSSDGKLIEAVELNDHPFFLAVQFHPELTHPDKPHPLFVSFLKALAEK